MWGEEDPGTVGAATTLFHGRPLVPFADRITGGRYRWEGETYRLPINDPEMGDAIHGFLYAQPMVVESIAHEDEVESRIVLSTTLAATPGYPWPLRVRLTYRLTLSGFSFHVWVRNEGDDVAPYTVGWHPYFLPPGEAESAEVNETELRVDAERYLEVDEHLRLTGKTPHVAGGPLDFRTFRPVGPAEVDVALDVARDTPREAGPERSSGGAAATLRGRNRQVSLYLGGLFRRIQLFVPPGRRAVAVEPVSAPGEAFNDPSLGVTRLEPGVPVEAWAQVELSR